MKKLQRLEPDDTWTMEEKEFAKEINYILDQQEITEKELKWLYNEVDTHLKTYDTVMDKENHRKVTYTYQRKLMIDMEQLNKLREKYDILCDRVNKYYYHKD